MKKNQPYLSVVIPTYNEVGNFKTGEIEKLYTYLRQQNYSFEVIFVDDGSTDNTSNLLKTYARHKKEVRIISNPHLGKGPSVTTGMLAATGENRLFTDFDQATPISEVEKLLPFRHKGYDVVIGSREVKGAKREREPFYRHLMGKGFNFGIKIIAIRGINDTQCGFKLFSAQATEKLFPLLTLGNITKPRTDAFTGALDVELLFLAQKLNFKIAEVPVSWRFFRTTRVNPVKDSLRMAFEVIKIRLNDIAGKYK